MAMFSTIETAFLKTNYSQSQTSQAKTKMINKSLSK